MNKLLFSILLLIVTSISAYSQTYYYKQVSLVDEYGVKRAGNNRILCISFVNERRMCYWSDKNGNNTSKYESFTYKSTNSKGVHLYESTLLEVGKQKIEDRRPGQDYFSMMAKMSDMRRAERYGAHTAGMISGFASFRFSNDFKRLNVVYTKGTSGQKPTEVWERVNAAEEADNSDLY